MSSRNSLPLETVDLIIAQALQDGAKTPGPSPMVWRRIRRRARAWTASQRYAARLGRLDVAARRLFAQLFPPQTPSHHRRTNHWQLDSIVIHWMDYGGLNVRLGW
ncbi:MAG: hypothetical protein JW900_09385 [Anaerolineae bacterium]|nr:hypothetical protein [Anaerolineae bacterium]